MKSQDYSKGENATWIEVARAGTFKDSSGASHTFTVQNFTDMASSYNPEKREAPLVIGHPSINGPAYGWVKALKIKDEKLCAYVACVTDEVKRSVDNGSYRYVSMSLYPDRGLRHIGLLGANPPAIDGLAPVSFESEEAAIYINFNQEQQDQQKGSFMNPEELLKRIEELRNQLTALTQERDEAKKEIENLKAELAGAKTEEQKTANEFAAYRDAREKEIISARIEGFIKDGKVAPAEKLAVEKTAEALRHSGKLDFADGAENPLKIYFDSLDKRSPSALLTNFSAPATGGEAEQYQPMSGKL